MSGGQFPPERPPGARGFRGCVAPVAAILPLMMPAPRLASIKRRHIESTQNNCFLNGFLYWQPGERTGSWTWRKAHKFKASPPPYIMDPQLPPG